MKLWCNIKLEGSPPPSVGTVDVQLCAAANIASVFMLEFDVTSFTNVTKKSYGHLTFTKQHNLVDGIILQCRRQ